MIWNLLVLLGLKGHFYKKILGLVYYMDLSVGATKIWEEAKVCVAKMCMLRKICRVPTNDRIGNFH